MKKEISGNGKTPDAQKRLRESQIAIVRNLIAKLSTRNLTEGARIKEDAESKRYYTACNRMMRNGIENELIPALRKAGRDEIAEVFKDLLAGLKQATNVMQLSIQLTYEEALCVAWPYIVEANDQASIDIAARLLLEGDSDSACGTTFRSVLSIPNKQVIDAVIKVRMHGDDLVSHDAARVFIMLLQQEGTSEDVKKLAYEALSTPSTWQG